MKRGMFAGKRIEGVLAVCLLFVFLTGCGKGEVQLQSGTNLQLEKDGSVLVTYIEDFPSDYYDVTELETMNRQEVDAYNQQSGSEVVEIVNTQTDGSRLTLAMRFDDMEDYAGMNGVSAYNGTVSQARALGYDLNMNFRDIRTGESVADINWEDLGEYHIAVINEPATVYTHRKIVYVTDGIRVSEDKKMATVTGETQSVIVFK